MRSVRDLLVGTSPGVDALAQRYGWRGLSLILLGSVWLVVGAGVMAQDRQSRSLLAMDYLPPLLIGACWWATAAVAILQGLRGPGRDDTTGYVALFIMPAFRCAAYLVAWALWWGAQIVAEVWATFGWGTVPQVGHREGWFAALVWGTIVVFVFITARRPESVVVLPPPPEAGRAG